MQFRLTVSVLTTLGVSARWYAYLGIAGTLLASLLGTGWLWQFVPRGSKPLSRDKAAGALSIVSIGNKASEPWLELVHLAVLVPEGVEARDARISAEVRGAVYSLMWSTNDGPKDERTLRADAANNVLIVIRSTKDIAFNSWGRPRPAVPIAQNVSYIADGELLAHQRVDGSRQLPAGRHQVAVGVTWGVQRASRAFDLMIPPTTSAPIVLMETPASVE